MSAKDRHSRRRIEELAGLDRYRVAERLGEHCCMHCEQCNQAR
jgi:hypothetical protein